MASTFENNLRLEEIGTGEQSGTWGTKTNVNLELITDGLSYSSTGEAIANAAAHTITMADGVADEFRSFYLKCTGGGQACTVTLAPNTLSKVWVIENTTSYTLTFSQGSGANVAILAGQVKMIATDGAGSGAAVFDLMQDLAVPDLFVDDDLTLQSDGAVINFGVNAEIQLTHVHDVGLLLTETGGGAPTIQFRDSAISVSSSADATLDLAADGDINLTAGVDINIPANVGLTFGNDAEKIEGDGTDLTISGNNINLTAVADIVVPANVGITFGTGEKIEGDNTDLTITSGAKINLAATSDVHLANNIGMVFGDSGEKIEGDGTNLAINSSGDVNITATTVDLDGNLEVSGTITLGSGAVISEAELELLDGVTAGTAIASKVVTTDANIDTTGQRNLTITGVATAASVVVDNITVDGNTISTTDTNGNLIITPNGTGNVNINSDTLAVSGAEGESAALVLNADEADDNADTWRIASNTGNTLTIENQISGSAVSHLTITPNATVANSTFAVAGGLTTGGTVTASTGGSSTPSFTFSGDTNTGIFKSANDTIGFTTGGTERVQIGSFGVAADTLTNKTSSTSVTIDSAVDITLDADSGNWRFKDDGTSILEISRDSNTSVTLFSAVADMDILFKGSDSDGGGTITALTLDMSNAGAATFNSSVTTSGPIQALAGNDLRAFSSDDSVFLSIKHNEIDLSSGDLTIDVAGDIILDADGNEILFKHAGDLRYEFKLDSTPDLNVTGGNFTIQTQTDDADILFKGSDGGVGITALTLKMSQGGEADFNSAVKISGPIVAHQTNKGVLEYSNNIFMLRAYGANAGDGKLQFKTGGGGGSTDTLAMTIDDSQNVGIGTDSPDSNSRLHIKKTGADAKITIETDESNDCYINFSGATAEASIGYEPGANTLVFANSADGLTSNSRLVIDSSGDVGINMAPDSGVKLSVSGAVGTTNGSEGSPTHTFYSDADTGMYRAGANTLGFSTGGTERMRLENTGAVIRLGGTTNAGYIDFDGTSIQLNTQRNPNSGSFTNTGRAHSSIVLFDGNGTAANSYIRFMTATSNNTVATERLRITSAGDITLATGSDLITTTASGSTNTRIGTDAGSGIVASNAGLNNVLIGVNAGTALDSGDSNVAIGVNALMTEDDHANNVAIGYQALKVQDAGADAYNVAIGYQAGVAVSTGTSNTFVGGLSAGLGAVTGSHNVGVGTETLYDLTSGASNVAIGFQAGSNLTSGSQNIAIGREALETEDGHGKNVAIGFEALKTQNVGADGFNVAVGHQAGNLLQTGTYNTLLGPQAGFNITNGSNNTIVGQFDGNNQGLDIRSASNNIVLSDGAGAVHLRTHVVSSSQRQIEIGHYGSGSSNQDFVTFLAGDGDSQPSAANKNGLVLSNGYSGAQVKIYAFGTSTWTAVEFLNTHGHTGQQIGSITLTENNAAYNTSSDYRLKTDAQPMTGATNRLKQLNPVNFEWISDGTRVDGFLAHEAQAVVPEAVTGTKDAMRDEEYEVTPAVTDDDGNVTTEAVMGTRSVPDYQGIDQSKLVPLLVATIQELEARITALESA